jgi:hypothetical protein
MEVISRVPRLATTTLTRTAAEVLRETLDQQLAEY